MIDPILALAALITVGSAIGVVASRESVHSALFLTVHLIGVAGLFLALTYQFLALAQVLVYAGAVMVVFLFAVNTLSPDKEKVSLSDKDYLPAIGIAGGLSMLVAILLGTLGGQSPTYREVASHELETIQTFALNLFGPFLLPFEATAFVLLVALIGAVILGGRRKDAR